jgi:glycopeptide antibiotics resistance protein
MRQQMVQNSRIDRPLLLLAACLLLLITYGSLWPFIFGSEALVRRIGYLFLARGIMATDVAENIAAFVPLGMILSAVKAPHLRRWGILLALLVAVVLQLAQLFIPARSPALYDALFNSIGLGLGFGFGGLLHNQRRHAPWLLAQAIGLLPLVQGLMILSMRLGIGKVWDPWRLNRDEMLAGAPVLLLAAAATGLALRCLLPLRLALVVGAGCALCLWLGVPLVPQARAGLLLLALLAAGLLPLRHRMIAAVLALLFLLLADGLLPWRPLLAQPMQWVPLRGLMLSPNLPLFISMAGKLFLWSALTLLLLRLGCRPWRAALMVLLPVTAVEVAQTYIASGTPDITDIVLAMLAVALIVQSRRTVSP